MAYLGNDLQVAFPVYRNIDDISGSFNSSTTSFPLRVSGVAPVPAPLYSQQCLISVGGVVQRPDDTGSEGFRLSGGNIIFASAPTTGADFFGVILAGADYINAGGNFPSGTAAVPSITFNDDLDTGIYNSGINQVSITTGGSERLRIDSAGQIESVSLGTAAAPAFSFTTDPNSGIYSPGADQVAISTGGSGRLFVDASGNVGVGQAPKTQNLLGSGQSIGLPTATIANFDNSGSGNYQLQLLLNAYRDGSGTFRYLKSSGVASQYTQDNSGNHIWWTAPSGTADNAVTFSERLRITSAGLVGVGTSSPNVPLQVIGGATVTDPVIRATNTGGTQSMALMSGGLRMDGGAPIQIFQGGSEVARIDTSGRLGVGTTNPLSRLHVEDSGEPVIYIRRDTTSATSLGGPIWRNNSFNVASIITQNVNANSADLTFSTSSGGSLSERLRIDSSGRVGIGVSSVSGKLHIGDDALGDPALVLQTTDSATSNATIRWRNNAGADRSFIGSNFNVGDASGNLEFGTSSTTNMVLTSAGRLGIGTTSPTSKLQVDSGASASVDTVLVAGASSLFSYAYSSAATGASFYGLSNANTTGIQSFGSAITFGTYAAQPVIFGTSNAERARIDSSGRLLVGTSSSRQNGFIIAQHQVEGVTNSGAAISVTNNQNSAEGAYLVFAKSRAGSVGGVTLVQSNDVVGLIRFAAADGTDTQSQAAQIVCEIDGTPGVDDTPGRLVFSTTADGASSPTERMRINSAGQVGIGSSPSNIYVNSVLSLQRGSTASNAVVANIFNTAATSTSKDTNNIVRISSNASGADVNINMTDGVSYNYNFGGNNGGAYVMATTNGVRLSNGGTSWASDSDERVKDIIEPIENGLDKISTLRAVIGKYKTDDEDKRRSFLIAQDVQAVLPEAVYDEQGTLMLAYTDTIPLLVAALKESKERIEQLEAKIAALETA